MKKQRDLDVPAEVNEDPDAIEVVRAWIANEGLVCNLRPAVWEETPAAWGVLLADLTQHIADALSEHSGHNRVALIKAIRDTFNSELRKPME